MKKRILALGLVLALLAVMALPMAVFADSGTTDVTGTLVPTFTLIAPSTFVWGTDGKLALDANTGSAAMGSVVTNQTDWSFTVTDNKTATNGKMTIGGEDTASLALADAIQVGMTSGTLTTIPEYQAQLRAHTGTGTGYYGNTGTFSIPLYASQTVEGTDAAGTYSITLTYTATPKV